MGRVLALTGGRAFLQASGDSRRLVAVMIRVGCLGFEFCGLKRRRNTWVWCLPLLRVMTAYRRPFLRNIENLLRLGRNQRRRLPHHRLSSIMNRRSNLERGMNDLAEIGFFSYAQSIP